MTDQDPQSNPSPSGDGLPTPPAANDAKGWESYATSLKEQNERLTRQVNTYKGHAIDWQTKHDALNDTLAKDTSEYTSRITTLEQANQTLTSQVSGFEDQLGTLTTERDQFKGQYEQIENDFKLQAMVANDYPELLDMYQDLKLEGTEEDIKGVLDKARGKFGAKSQQDNLQNNAGGAPPPPSGNVPTQTAESLEAQLADLRHSGKQNTPEYSRIHREWILLLGS